MEFPSLLDDTKYSCRDAVELGEIPNRDRFGSASVREKISAKVIATIFEIERFEVRGTRFRSSGQREKKVDSLGSLPCGDCVMFWSSRRTYLVPAKIPDLAKKTQTCPGNRNNLFVAAAACRCDGAYQARGDVQYYRVEEWFRRGEKMHHKFQDAQDEKTAARPRRLSREAPRHGSWRDESWHARLQESAKAEEWMVGTCRKHIISNRLHRSRSKSADTAT
ncbi:hypothetical protein B0H13DRAFT_1901379 [Mycena leptocephala]|nr:hypothetical protein B0H13DRAFT_1901379 [Mycena leptocephala]